MNILPSGGLPRAKTDKPLMVTGKSWNAVVDAIEGVANRSVGGPGMALSRTAAGTVEYDSRTPEIWARITGGDNEDGYTWEEVHRDESGWATTGTVGTIAEDRAREVNDRTVPNGTIVRMTRNGAGQEGGWLFFIRPQEDSSGPACRFRVMVRGCAGRSMPGLDVTITVTFPDTSVVVHERTTDDFGIVEVTGVEVGSTVNVVVNEDRFEPFNESYVIDCFDEAVGFFVNANLSPAEGFACLVCCARPFPSTIYLTFESGLTIPLNLVNVFLGEGIWEACHEIPYTVVRYRVEKKWSRVPVDSPCYMLNPPTTLPPIPDDDIVCASGLLRYGTDRLFYETVRTIVLGTEVRQARMAVRLADCTLELSNVYFEPFLSPGRLDYVPVPPTSQQNPNSGVRARFSTVLGYRFLSDADFNLETCVLHHSIPPGLPPEGECLFIAECESQVQDPYAYTRACDYAFQMINNNTIQFRFILNPSCESEPSLSGKWSNPYGSICCPITNERVFYVTPPELCRDQDFTITE